MIIPGQPLHTVTKQHIPRLSSKAGIHIQALDWFIRTLLFYGLWNKFAVICVAGGNQADTLLNLKGGSGGTVFGSPTHTAYQGLTLDTNAKYVDTGFFFDASYNDNQSMFVYTRDGSTGGNGTLMGCFHSPTNTTVCMAEKRTLASPPAEVSGYLQKPSGVLHSFTPTSQVGLRVASRTSSADVLAGSRNGITPGSVLSFTLLTSLSVFVGNINLNGAPGSGTAFGPLVLGNFSDEYAAWGIGYGLTSVQAQQLHTALQGYFLRLGTAV